MSYDIFYDRQFIKLDEKTFIPMVLAGSNNFYELRNRGKERRERSWFNLSYLLDGAISGTMEQMLETQKKVRAEKVKNNPEYDDKSFGYYTALSAGGRGCNMTYGQYIGITKTGCKKALTIEQLAEENVSIHIRTFASEKTREILREQGLEPISFIPRTTEEMIDFIENVEPKYRDAKEGRLSVSFYGMYESAPKRIRRKYFKKEASEKKEIKSKFGFAISITTEGNASSFGYLTSYRGGAFRYVRQDCLAKCFIDKREADKLASLMNKRRSDFKFEVVVVEYEREMRFFVKDDKNIVLPSPELAQAN